MIGHDKILGTLLQQMACSWAPISLQILLAAYRTVDEPETRRAVTKRHCRLSANYTLCATNYKGKVTTHDDLCYMLHERKKAIRSCSS